MARAPRVAVVGGGITGLAAAFSVLRDLPGAEVVVLEASDRVGGKIQTTPFEGRLVDCAADAFLARVPEAVELCRALGLDDQLVTPAVRHASIFTGGQLRRFPPDLVLGVPTDLDALHASGVVSAAAVERAERDLSMPEPPSADDESVGQLVRRRVGDEVFETLVEPLLSGVYAGSADELSARIAAPQFVTALREHGSLIGGLRAQLAAADRNAPVFYGLRGGTQVLVDALAAWIRDAGGELALRVPATHVERTARHTRVVTAEGHGYDADAVVVAVPDDVAASLLGNSVPSVARELASVPYASVVMVTLAVPADGLGVPLDGTGFLVPAREGLLLTACSWASSKWAHLQGPSVILRASAGRLGDERAMAMNDEELVEALLADLGRTMDLRAAPLAVRVSRWPRALPQFRPGHLDRVAHWRREVYAALPGVALAGAGIEGLGIPACIRQAQRAALEVVASLAA
jgi:oxygen-dependent protoporphyrinogen oxidase